MTRPKMPGCGDKVNLSLLVVLADAGMANVTEAKDSAPRLRVDQTFLAPSRLRANTIKARANV